MRSTFWTLLAAAITVQAQNTMTVSVCNSYSYSGTITFVEYSTTFAGGEFAGGATMNNQTMSSSVDSRPDTSISELFTGGVTASHPSMTPSLTMTMRTGADDVPGNGTSFVIPGQDTVAPATPIPTISSSSSTSSSTTGSSSPASASTAPDAASGQFYITFSNSGIKRLSKRSVQYLAFDDASESVLVDAEENAALFVLGSDGSLMTAGDPDLQQYIALEDITPPRFILQYNQPDPLVLVNVYTNGTVSIQGVDGFCTLQDSTLAISLDGDGDGDFPSDCQSVMPELVALPTTMTTATPNPSSMNSSTDTVNTTTDTDTEPSTSSLNLMTTAGATVSSSADATSSSTSPTSSLAGPATTTMIQSQVPITSVSSASTGGSTPTESGSTSTNSQSPIVTDRAYIDTVIRHHNYHRLNHSAPALSWNSSLASSARDIAENCIYAHNTTTDGGGYGQNIAAGYLPIQMSYLISDGFYNGEVNSYTYYGGEPDLTTLHSWGHFSQIVWVGTLQVGCYTNNCTASGLGNVDPSTGIRPFFTVCNYYRPGNYVKTFGQNVLSPIGLASIHAGYGCPNDENCVDESV